MKFVPEQEQSGGFQRNSYTYLKGKVQLTMKVSINITKTHEGLGLSCISKITKLSSLAV